MQHNLIIEVDGPIHDRQKKYDREREEYLHRFGFKILRFKNDDVLKNLSTVLATIHRAATTSSSKSQRLAEPSPSPGVENGVVGEG